ncbi:Mitochondrial intermediate peptidase [Orchesella cincta]|uniref:Mitochondrial intermediate peptidase n=1 Tax=Orchesella cincta TaxID=48709 RepID=A0A1D2NEL0_ORCCI|nr:Mitochondrial intermediate peptidase [Orchesella cincta]
MHDKLVDFSVPKHGGPARRNSSIQVSPKQSSHTFSLADEQTKDILAMLRHSIDKGELKLKQNNKIDNETQAPHMERLGADVGGKKDDSDDDEAINKADEERNEMRLQRLAESRPRWIVYFLEISFHVMVFANFFLSWYDSSMLLVEDAKMGLWLLEDDFNCLEIVSNVDWVDHMVNIFHALLSCSVLYVHNKNSAPLCLAWVFSQAAHMIFKIFQAFYNEKFEKEAYADLSRFYGLIRIILFDIIGAVLLLHKYYDLTDLFKTRARYFGTTDTSERSINDRIIYRNDSAYLQRKTILREATTAQTYAIIKKIGKHARQGIPVEPISLKREINAARLALEDCETAENHNMMHILKKAYARRLKELEDQVLKAQQQKAAAKKKDSFERNPPIIQSEMY